MRIVVTAKDIQKGVHGSTVSCPIAIAVKRHFNTYITVSSYTLTINKDKIQGWNSYKLPVKATEFIYKFDRYFPVMPFWFNLELKDD